jgi:hypothetical protein
VVVNRGEVVVKIVVKRGALRVTFDGWKLRQLFEDYLEKF